MTQNGLTFPHGRTFAFTIVDDTDVATADNIRPIYALLKELGLRTTKTVWPLSIDAPNSNFVGSETLEDAHYVDFVLGLQADGFEITWHSAAMESSTRPDLIRALERFAERFGHFPRIHVSHAENRENPYWGVDRVDSKIVRWILRRGVKPPDYYQGHVEGSPYYWGDQCARHIEYGRNLTFGNINLARVNPSMPYRDPHRPLVKRWFSASDAEDAEAFVKLLSSRNQDRLEQEGGFCIVATHFGKGFCRDGTVDSGVRDVLTELASRPGWFPPTGELLDWLLRQRASDALPRREWRRMQTRFLVDGMARRLGRMLGL